MAAIFAGSASTRAGVSAWPRYATSYEINCWVWLAV
jgi:hypothetical protein